MKYILITGVSTGIGYETAKCLIREGHFVFGSVRTEEDARRVASEMGSNFHPLLFDVTDGPAIEQAATVVAERVGERGLFALVNNAGISHFGPLEHLALDKIRHQFEVNVFGLLKVTQVFLPLLKQASRQGASAGRGALQPKIINLSSVSGIFSTPFLGPYCASKFALESLSDSLRRELLPFRVDVVLIQPGPVATPIWEKARAETETFTGTDYEKIYKVKDWAIKNSERRALPVERVAEKICGIVAHPSPRTRYLMTATPWQVWLLKWLPDRWVDGIFRKAFQKFSNHDR